VVTVVTAVTVSVELISDAVMLVEPARFPVSGVIAPSEVGTVKETRVEESAPMAVCTLEVS
jgi:SRSO17 transposase